MWKKQDDAVGPQPEFASTHMPDSTLDSDGEALIKAYRDRQAEKGSSHPVRRSCLPQATISHRRQQPWRRTQKR